MNPHLLRGLLATAFVCLAGSVARADEFTIEFSPWIVSDPGLAEVQRLERSGRPDDAVELLDLMKENGFECSPDHLPAGVADYMAARIFEHAGRRTDAADRYRAAAASPLGDAASWKLGGLLSEMGDVSGARAAFAAVSSSSSWWVQARLSLAAGLADEGRPAAAVTVLRGVLDTDAVERDLHDVRLALARALDLGGDRAAAVAVAKAAFMLAGDPGRAGKALALLEKMGAAQDGTLETLRRVVRANRRELKNLEVVARKRPAVFLRQDPALSLVVRAAYSLASRADPEKASGFLAKALAVAVNRDVRAYILSLQGEALVDLGNDTGAAAVWSRLVSEYPDSPFAVEAGFSGARAWMRAGSHGAALSLLKMVEERIPAGGSSLSLRWERALAAMMSGNPSEALAALDAILGVTDHGDGVLFGAAERARYFRAVVLHDMGEDDEARLDMTRVARSSEYSWFGILARSRIHAWYGQRFDSIAGQDSEAAAFDRAMPVRLRRADSGDRRRVTVTDRGVGALFLWRMDERQAAEAELIARARRGMLRERDLVLLSMIKASAPESSKAMRAASWLRSDFDPGAAWLWAAAYPRPFRDAVLDAAGRFDVDPALIYGVMRAESNFRPSVRSPAGAYGLMQVMRQTGRTIIRKVLAPAGISASLQKPAGNVLIGTALLDRLIVHFDGYLPLVLASYNAGSGAGRRFLKTLGHLPTDLLVEAIPYPETRDYVKRVSGFAAAYRYLYGDTFPLRVGFAAPAETGPWIDVRSARRPDIDVSANPAGECRAQPGSGSGLRHRK